MDKITGAMLALSVIIIGAMAWNTRGIILSVPLYAIALSSVVVMVSFVVHAVKWQIIKGEFSLESMSKYNSSQIMSPLPVFVQDPIRLKMLGWNEANAAGIIWDRATDMIAIMLLSIVLMAKHFPKALAWTAIGISGLSVAYFITKDMAKPLLGKIVPEKTLKEFSSGIKKKPLQIVGATVASMFFWTINFYPVEILLSSIKKSPGTMKAITSMATALFLSTVNPLPMAAGSLEFVFSVAASVPFQVSMAIMAIFRLVSVGTQMATAAITMMIDRRAQSQIQHGPNQT